jgi:hypothetical protein
MTTRIYGASDDLIEFDGDVRGEVGAYGLCPPRYGNDEDKSGLVMCSDGTVLSVAYGDFAHRGIWKLTVLQKGSLLERVDVCDDEAADPYSDVAHFADGLKWAYVAKGKWERVE